MNVGGTCDPRFAVVREEFVHNFTQRDEHGGAVWVSIDGRTVVDLWGGWADAGRTRAWTGHTLVNAFSVGKGVAAAVAARLREQGRIDPDGAVARFWPEFAAAGKEAVTVAQVLSHEAGLPAVRRRLPPGAMFDHEVMATALAAQEPWWEPGTAHGYHVNTFGFLVGELVRRVTGRTLGAVIAEDVAGPFEADIHLGLPASEDHRVAEFLWTGPTFDEAEPAGLEEHALMVHNAYANPGGLSGMGVVNTRAWRAAEIPSTNMHASARGVGRFYETLAAGRLVGPAALAEAVRERVNGEDLVLGRPSRFGLGFQLTQPERPLGPNAGAFGHFGAGGSLGFCDPEAGLAFGYVMNAMGARWQNPRNRALIDAVYRSLGVPEGPAVKGQNAQGTER